jgi:hypothetical protein
MCSGGTRFTWHRHRIVSRGTGARTVSKPATGPGEMAQRSAPCLGQLHDTCRQPPMGHPSGCLRRVKTFLSCKPHKTGS